MRDQLVDLRLFRYALVSAEYGSFRQAALALGVQQSSVSKGVGDLEQRVGVALFERNHAGVRITPAGERFLKEASLGLDHLRRAMRRHGDEGKVSVAASVPVRAFADVLMQFHREHNGTAVEVENSNCESGVARVRQGAADIAFVSVLPSDGSLRSVHLGEIFLCMVLAKSHFLATAQQVSLRDARGDHLRLTTHGLGPTIGNQLRKRSNEIAGACTILMSDIDQSEVVELVRCGLGLTVMPRAQVTGLPEDLVAVGLADVPSLPIYAIWNEGRDDHILRELQAMIRRLAVDRQ